MTDAHKSQTKLFKSGDWNGRGVLFGPFIHLAIQIAEKSAQILQGIDTRVKLDSNVVRKES